MDSHQFIKEFLVVVAPSDDAVLQAFLKQPNMDTPQLEEVVKITKDPARVLRSLKRRYGGIFSDAIETPVKKGSGGFFVRIREAEI